MAETDGAVLQARGADKAFGHVQALVDADLDLYPGEVLAVVGDNGAGKSTLIKCLSGAYVPELRADRGRRPTSAHPLAARCAIARIATVYQDLALVDQRDVATNLCMGREPVGRFGLVDRKALVRQADATLARLNARIPSVNTPVAVLSGGQRQAVAIGRALAQGRTRDHHGRANGRARRARIGPGARADPGIAGARHLPVVISHNLQHVFSIADRIEVMRGGRCVGVRQRAETSGEEIVRMITGADVLVLARWPERAGEVLSAPVEARPAQQAWSRVGCSRCSACASWAFCSPRC